MREIKFRAWDKKEKRMFEVRILRIFADVPVNRLRRIKYGVAENNYTCKNPTELMQFTGLKDKNGKEIYEGDIIRWCNECIFVIRWSDSGWGFYYDIIRNIIKNTDFDIRLYRSDESALIKGNIYQNPNYIKGYKG